MPVFTAPPALESSGTPKLYQPLALVDGPGAVELAIRLRPGAAPVEFADRLREIATAVDPALRLRETRTAAESEWLRRRVCSTWLWESRE